MKQFLARFGSEIGTVLSGFDRLVFRGHLIALLRPAGMPAFLKRMGVQLVDLKSYVLQVSESVKRAAAAACQELGRPSCYLSSSRLDKEALVQQILQQHPIDEGLVCMFTVVEPCLSFEYQRSADRNERGLQVTQRKCLHIYRYFRDPEFGLIGTRLQTWFPFNIQVWMNGREWLSTQMRRGGIDFHRDDNAVTWAADPQAAQRFLEQQLTYDWRAALERIRRQIHPRHESIFKDTLVDYYWSVYQSEWATDLLFERSSDLATLYPFLWRHAMLHFGSRDVMRFLGRRISGRFTEDVISRFNDRAEGVRVKHWIDGNSVKMYDKAKTVLRVETTIGNPGGFRVFRPRQNDPDGPRAWQPLRKGIADLHRRAEVSQAVNQRYLDALAAVDNSTPVSRILDDVSHSIVRHGRRTRAIRIGDATDLAVLRTISDARFTLGGVRNRDLRAALRPKSSRPNHDRRLAARVTRLLRILRAHGIIRKIPRTHRYTLTAKGIRLTTALFAVRNASTTDLLHAA